MRTPFTGMGTALPQVRGGAIRAHGRAEHLPGQMELGPGARGSEIDAARIGPDMRDEFRKRLHRQQPRIDHQHVRLLRKHRDGDEIRISTAEREGFDSDSNQFNGTTASAPSRIRQVAVPGHGSLPRSFCDWQASSAWRTRHGHRPQ